MIASTMGAVGLVTLSLLAASPARPAAPAGRGAPSGDLDKAIQDLGAREFAVREQAARAGAMFHQVADEALAVALPQHIAYSVIFRQYPVARRAPEPLKTQNLFLVGKDGSVQVTDTKGLEDFFGSKLTPVQNEFAGKNAARAWLALSQELKQDGFYRFVIPEESLKWDNGTRQASGKAQVSRGGNGEIAVTLTFDEAGKLTRAEETVKLRPGPRPICQATKLLDADPIVRRMAEQDLLIMGREVKPYLDEQRAKAGPELQKAIDRLWERIVREDQ